MSDFERFPYELGAYDVVNLLYELHQRGYQQLRLHSMMAIIKALDSANLKFINFTWFEHKIKSNTDHAIGIYLNYLEVGNIIVMPAFGVPGIMMPKRLPNYKKCSPTK